MFGAGSFLAADGKTAQIPDYVTAGEKWFNDGVWKDHFIPNANQVASALLGAGGEFGSGNLAMDEAHTWFTCCVAPAAPAKQFKFGFAVIRPTTARSRPRSMPTRSASSRPPRSRTRPSRP